MTLSNHFRQKIAHRAALTSLVALGVLGGSSTFAASDITNVTATVIEPIAIAKTADLTFGDFAPGAGGAVTVDTAGTRTTSGPILSTVVPGSAAKFDVSGDADATYSISFAGSDAVLTDSVSTETMALSTHSAFAADTTVSGNVSSGTLTAGAQSIYLGGVLTVAAIQAAGSYTGNVSVTVEYN
jgi:hypothetical protein